MTARLILLSHHPDVPSTCLLSDSDGHILERMRLAPDVPLAASPVPIRTVLVVPGVDARAVWLDLPARNPIQASAAAALLIEDHIATTGARLHIAIASGATAGAGDASRLVVVVDVDVMQHWMDRAAALGVSPDAVVPDHLMLPSPTTGGVCVAVLGDDRWLVRGEQLAFSAEPALAAMVIGESPVARIEDASDIEREFVAMAADPPIDLLQYQFARASTRREGWPAYRRAAALIVALALSPLVLTSAQALRYELAARDLESQAEAVARAVIPGISTGVPDALAETQSLLLELRSGDDFARAAGALFAAVERTQGAHLDSLDYRRESGLRAALFHATPGDLESVKSAISVAGMSLQQTGTQIVDGGIRSDIVLRAGQ